jgi:hypothetical protein
MNRSAALLIPALLVPLIASALDFSFYGHPPDYAAGGTVKIAAGVLPGIRKQPLYRFEWQPDKSARFYELADPAMLERLTQQNAADTASPEGKKYELSAVPAFFDGAKVLRKCLPPKFLGRITAFFVVTEKGKRGQTIVMPEGGIAECITESASSTNFPKPPHRFTVKAEIDVR